MSLPGRSIGSPLARVFVGILITLTIAPSLLNMEAIAQGRRRGPVKYPAICGNPMAPCKSVVTWPAYNLPFRLPENAVIYETNLFYAIILKSVKAAEDNCDVFIPETERLAAQSLFPANKVFASRCFEPGDLSYTNTSANTRFMAVYAGPTVADANRMLAAVKATGKFPGANIRRMRAVMNGT